MNSARGKSKYVLCVVSHADEIDIKKAKFYPVVDPEPNDPEDFIRIIDESTEDYLYPRDWFAVIDLPEAVTEALDAMYEGRTP